MTETVRIDIDPLLLQRVRRVAQAQGWSEQQAFVHLLEHGLFTAETELAAQLDDSDARALQEAIAALEQVQDDPGFSLIGRAAGSTDDDATPTQGTAGVDRHLGYQAG